MKKNTIALLIATFIVSTFQSFSQSVGINSTGAAPDPSAMLDVNSTNKGFLPPRMTTSERNAIAQPEEGLIIYNKTTKRPNYFDGTVWMNYDGTSAMTLGDTCNGGIVVYYFQPGDGRYLAGEVHGIVCSQVCFARTVWGCYGTNIAAANLTAC